MIFPAFSGNNLWKDRHGMKYCNHCSRDLEYCPSDEPGEEGIIPETFRKRPVMVRSCHPTHSWGALGAKAELFVKNNYQAKTPCGPGNPFETLVKENGCIVCLGVMVNTITLWHYYEDLLMSLIWGIIIQKQGIFLIAHMGEEFNMNFPG